MKAEVFNLWRAADAIPELGGGGRTIAPSLVELASTVPGDQAIVDIGPWLGSQTAFLALGAYINPGHPTIHSYDLWKSNYRFRKKAWAKTKVPLPDDFWKLWAANVIAFPAEIIPHRENVLEWCTVPAEPIGLLVDDATSGKLALDCMFQNFAPTLAPGAVVVMCDYYFYETKPQAAAFAETVQWFEDHAVWFDGPVRIPGARNTAAYFTYAGGWRE